MCCYSMQIRLVYLEREGERQRERKGEGGKKKERERDSYGWGVVHVQCSVDTRDTDGKRMCEHVYKKI